MKKLKLTREQRLAVNDNGKEIVLIAGPGTGKTTVIERRIRCLLEKTGVTEDQILALTFGKEAAKNLKLRLGKSGFGADVLACTSHSFAQRQLLHGRDGILDPQQAKSILVRANAEYPDIGIDIAGLAAIIGYARNSAMDIPMAIDRRFERWSAFREQIENVASTYQSEKKRRGIMDYDDLIMVATERLRVNAAQGHRLGYNHVIVDEYQDITDAQRKFIEAIMSALAPGVGHLFVVGDPAQAIHGFRGVSANWLEHFRSVWPNAKKLNLVDNHRSCQAILDLAHGIEEPFKLHRKLVSKKLTPGMKPVLKEFLTQKLEARGVARKIKRLIEIDDIRPKNIAVLARHHHDLLPIRRKLEEIGLDYQLSSSEGLLERDHIADVMAVVALGDGNRQLELLVRALQLYPGITLARAETLAATALQTLSLRDLRDKLRDLAPQGRKRLWALRRSLRLAGKANVTLDQKIVSISSWLGPLLAKKYHRSWSTMLPDFDVLKRLAEGHTARELQNILEENALDGDDPTVGSSDKVVLSTVHAAKGREWNVVFVLGLNDGTFPSQKAMGLEQLMEERRLFFVAATRAKRRLFLTRYLYGYGRKTDLSRFLRDRSVWTRLQHIPYLKPQTLKKIDQ